MYNPKSRRADEFIAHEEVMASLEYAEANKDNRTLIEDILSKAKECHGLNHREASVLLACSNPEIEAEIFALAEQIKKDFYGNYSCRKSLANTISYSAHRT